MNNKDKDNKFFQSYVTYQWGINFVVCVIQSFAEYITQSSQSKGK